MLLLCVALFAVTATAQLQGFETKIHDTVTDAEDTLAQIGNTPVALLPAYVKVTGPYGWEMQGWISITAPGSLTSCELLTSDATPPTYGIGGPCHGIGLTPTPTTIVYNAFVDAKAAFDAKPLIRQQSCVIIREPGQQAFTWLSATGRYWLTCQDTFFTFAC